MNEKGPADHGWYGNGLSYNCIWILIRIFHIKIEPKGPFANKGFVQNSIQDKAYFEITNLKDISNQILADLLLANDW